MPARSLGGLNSPGSEVDDEAGAPSASAGVRWVMIIKK